MKYRQAKKLIKKDTSLLCWIKSNGDWIDAAVDAILRSNELSPTCLQICSNFIDWTWKQCLEKSNRYGIKSGQLKRYCWKIYERKQ